MSHESWSEFENALSNGTSLISLLPPELQNILKEQEIPKNTEKVGISTNETGNEHLRLHQTDNGDILKLQWMRVKVRN